MSFISALLCLGMTMWGEVTWAQLLQQDFSSSTTVSNYVNAAAPTNGQFNAISTTGAGTELSINTGGANNKLRFNRSIGPNTGSFSRTTDFSPTPSTLMYRFNLAVSGTATAVTNFAVFQIGSGFGTANSAESNANVYARIGLNTTTTAGTFGLRNISTSTNFSGLSGTQAITWVVNNSGATTTYRAPDGTNESIADDRADIWVGTVRAFEDVAVLTATQTITDLKFVIDASNAIVDIDDLLIDPIPTIPNANVANPINSTSFMANWIAVAGVTGYRIDVSTASDFSSFVPGYENLYVAGQATNSHNITGLNPNTTYYYRVRGAAQYTVGEFASGNSGSQQTETTAPLITPTFDQLGPYCVGDTPDELPTSSTNGITGAWDPATVSTAAKGTITYTFTPDAGQGASATTMDITVNPKPTLTLTALSVSSDNCGDMVSVQIGVNNTFEDINSLQFSVNWDPAQLEYVSNTALQIGGGDPLLGTLDVASGNFVYTWIDPVGFDGEDLANNTVILTLNFKVKGTSGTASVNVTGSPTFMEVANSSFCSATPNVDNFVMISLENTPVTVEAGTPQTICVNQALDLNVLNASISGGATTGTWSSNGTGSFTGGAAFGSATAYVPSQADKTAGTVTLTLTSADPDGPCPAIVDTVIITIRNLNCSTFPWNGGNN